MDSALASGYAGEGAQEEDTLGLPTFAQFKKYATFRTEIADFGIDLKQLNRLLAECGYGIAVGGMGLGDITILFRSLAKRTPALNYEGVLRLCRMLRPRLAKLEVMMASSDDQGDPVKYRAGATTTTTTTTASAATTSGAVAGSGHGAGTSSGGAPAAGAAGAGASSSGGTAATWAAARGGMPSVASLRSRNMARLGSSAPVDLDAALAEEESGRRGGAEDLGPPGGGRGISFMQIRNRGLNRDLSGFPFAAGSMARPASASRASPTPPPAADGGSAGPSTSGRGPVPDGLATLMALKEPPVLLREHLPPPACPFPSIAARINGVQVLYRDGEMTRVALAVRDLQRDWEEAAAASALSKMLRRQAKASKAGGQSGAASSSALPEEPPPRGEIPLEGRIWLLLLHGCAMMLEGSYRTARTSLSAAEALYDSNKLGLEHPYHYCMHMFFGLLAYYEHKYDEAIEKFESAREVAELVSRGTLDVTARRNAAACLNNKGVCHSLLGNRSDAVIAFRAAHQLLRAVDGVPEVPEAVVALRNLNKSLKQGFALNTNRLRPTSAPPMYAHVGSTSIPKEEKLQRFLQSAITMRAPAPVTSAPAWTQKVTADDIVLRKKLKELEKKAKAKAAERGKGAPKPKKPPAFEAMTNYPFASYGVANVKLAAKKKGRKKKAA